MHRDEHIDIICDKLKKVWKKDSNLRLSVLLIKVMGSIDRVFHLDDSHLERALNKALGIPKNEHED